MKALELVRAAIAALTEKRAAAIEEMETIANLGITENRSFTPEEASTVEARQADITKMDTELDELLAREAELVEVEKRTAAIAARPSLQVIEKPDPVDTLTDRSATPQQLADAVTRSLEGKVEDPDNMAHARKIVLRHRKDIAWARSILARSTEVYSDAWAKVVTGRAMYLTDEERTALSTLTDANGNYLVPTHLDPTIILTNSGTSNAVRAISRVVTLTRPGDSSWQGITSAGITASFDAQLTEVSDDSPTFDRPSIPVHKAQALIQGSIEFFDDAFASELLMMFGDAKDRLEGTAHCTGSGTDQPTGIFTALDANTNVEIISDTAASIFKADLDEVYRSVPVRWRSKGTWLMNPIWALAIQNLGTALGASYSTDLPQGTTDSLYRKPVVESDDAPSSVTTTVRDNEIVFGDFSNYVIVDKPGSFAIEYIPQLFNTANNLPDGRRAWYAHWRTGADSVNDLAFRLLQDKTSA
jgi:HK97 family phage major capsid protein